MTTPSLFKPSRFMPLVSALAVACAFSACAPNAEQLRKTFEEHPEILTAAIEKNPDVVMNALQKASQAAQGKAQENAAKEEQNRVTQELSHPLKPELAQDRAYRGAENAPILIVEYSDFQCPFCKRGFDTVEQVRKEYGDKVRFMFKSLPLPFHPMAMPAAKRFEAIALQGADKAYRFHDLVFSSQDKLGGEGEKFLDAMAKKAGADLAKMKKDMDSPKVADRIKADQDEAQKFGISGTPGFVVNGVSIRGAYPFETFKEVIEKSLKKGS